MLDSELISVRRLRVFVEVADRLSFSLAARRLFLSQPSVSAHIKELERAVGAQLFERRKRSLGLTPAGRTLYEGAQKVIGAMTELESAMMAMSGAIEGRVAVGATELWEHLLPELLAEFQPAHPQVSVSVVSGFSKSICGLVLENQVAFGLVTQEPEDGRLECVKIGDVANQLIVIVPPEHPLAALEEVEPQALQRFPLVVYTSQQAGTIFSHLNELGVTNYALELSNVQGIKEAVRRGLGVSVLSEIVLGSGADEGLVCVPLAAPTVRWPLYGVRSRHRLLSRAEQALWEHTVTQYRPRISLVKSGERARA